MSHEHTFDEDTSDPDVLERTLLAMAEGVSGRLRHAGLKARTVTVKVRDSGFNTITRQRSLAEPTDMTEPIWRIALELARPEIRGKRIRLLGVGTSGFGEREQLGMFELGDDRRRRVVEASDEVRERFGTRAITRARLLRTGLPAPFAIWARRSSGGASTPKTRTALSHGGGSGVTANLTRRQPRMRSTTERGLTSNTCSN